MYSVNFVHSLENSVVVYLWQYNGSAPRSADIDPAFFVFASFEWYYRLKINLLMNGDNWWIGAHQTWF